jgi:LacI family transcriptional regulator
MMPGRVTIADVARTAGVSYQTVSRAINGKGEISAETRQRVLAAVEALGYRPSSIARGLATNRTLTIGLVVPDIANPFFPEIAKGAEEAARAAGYSLLLCNTTEDPEREARILANLEEKWVDGLVLCSSRLPDDLLGQLLSRHRAAILVNRPLPAAELAPDLPASSVQVDDALGARLAVTHLVRRGCRKIGFLAGPPASYSGRARREGYTAGLAAAGLAFDPGLILPCAPVLTGGIEAAGQMLAERPNVDALLCFNDLVAVGALQALTAAGRRVPQDVAVIGADDIALAALVTPALTTVRVAQHDIGARAVEALLRLVHGDDTGRATVVLRPELVVRESA